MPYAYQCCAYGVCTSFFKATGQWEAEDLHPEDEEALKRPPSLPAGHRDNHCECGPRLIGGGGWARCHGEPQSTGAGDVGKPECDRNGPNEEIASGFAPGHIRSGSEVQVGRDRTAGVPALLPIPACPPHLLPVTWL